MENTTKFSTRESDLRTGRTTGGVSMKNSTIVSMLLAIVVLSTATFAGDEPKGKGPGGKGFGQRPPEGGRPEMAGMMAQRMPLMMALDADKDGSISVSELENAPKALAKLDKDGDGALSQEELRPDFADMAGAGLPKGGPGGGDGPPSKEMMARMFEQRDIDKDGKLSGDEIPDRMKQNLTKVDENSDGAVDKSEMEKALAKMGDRPGKSRGAKGDKDGAGVKPKRPSTE